MRDKVYFAKKIKEYCIILVHYLQGWGANSKKGCFERKKFLGESQDFAWHREIFLGKCGYKVIFPRGLRFFDPKSCVRIPDFWEGIYLNMDLHKQPL